MIRAAVILAALMLTGCVYHRVTVTVDASDHFDIRPRVGQIHVVAGEQTGTMGPAAPGTRPAWWWNGSDPQLGTSNDGSHPLPCCALDDYAPPEASRPPAAAPGAHQAQAGLFCHPTIGESP